MVHASLSRLLFTSAFRPIWQKKQRPQSRKAPQAVQPRNLYNCPRSAGISMSAPAADIAPSLSTRARNRHCPKCQTGARDRWLEKRRRELLPTPYVHVVFTLPRQLASLALQNKKVVYDLLFRTSAAAAQRPTSPKARAASGNACTTTGPIPTASSSRRPTPTCGEARRATPTPSRVSPTARPTLTWSSRRQEPQGMGARLGAGDHRQARCGKGV